MKSDIQTAKTTPEPRTRSRHPVGNAEAHIFHITSQTLARPSVLLGAAIGAFVGSTSLYILAKYAGFSYSLSISIIWLITGAVLGLVFEAIITLLPSRRK
jgi:CBS-domain-containing membrane protein